MSTFCILSCWYSCTRILTHVDLGLKTSFAPSPSVFGSWHVYDMLIASVCSWTLDELEAFLCVFSNMLMLTLSNRSTNEMMLTLWHLLVPLGVRLIGGSDYKLIYRHYATLYFVFCVDSSESELGILDLIQVKQSKVLVMINVPQTEFCFCFTNSFSVCLQVFVETLDKCFENVCELDLIFHVDKVGNTFESVCLPAIQTLIHLEFFMLDLTFLFGNFLKTT